MYSEMWVKCGSADVQGLLLRLEAEAEVGGRDIGSEMETGVEQVPARSMLSPARSMLEWPGASHICSLVVNLSSAGNRVGSIR